MAFTTSLETSGPELQFQNGHHTMTDDDDKVDVQLPYPVSSPGAFSSGELKKKVKVNQRSPFQQF